MPPPGVPGPFSLADADGLARLLAAAGLVDVVVGELPVPLRAASVDEWWTRTIALAGPLAEVMAGLPQATVDAARARAHDAVRAYETPAGLLFPGITLLASARRTGA